MGKKEKITKGNITFDIKIPSTFKNIYKKRSSGWGTYELPSSTSHSSDKHISNNFGGLNKVLMTEDVKYILSNTSNGFNSIFLLKIPKDKSQLDQYVKQTEEITNSITTKERYKKVITIFGNKKPEIVTFDEYKKRFSHSTSM